jgi:hypothetical protein
MASGLVAKKIALFELKPPKPITEQNCRLKRKHAIRRKRYHRRERTLSGTLDDSLRSLRASEEYLDRLENASKGPYSSYAVANSFSSSCSALLDLIYNSERQVPKALDQTTSPQSMNFHDKRFLCRTSSLDEAIPARLNIIDIDIEIRVGISRTPSPPKDLYEPVGVPDLSSIEKIKLTATMESNSSRSSSNYTGSERKSRNLCINRINGESSPHAPNYYCTSCGTYNTNKDTLTEHIYENFALIPPPRPPKRFFGGSLSSNYNYNWSNGSSCDSSTNGNHARASSPAVFEKSSSNNQVQSDKMRQNDPNKKPTVTNDEKDFSDAEKEPYYEDLYDYCLPPNESCLDEIQPVAVTSFVSETDKDDEVEYCDCSTVMAMAIQSLNQFHTTSGHTDLYENEQLSLPSFSVTESEYEPCNTDSKVNDENPRKNKVPNFQGKSKNLIEQSYHGSSTDSATATHVRSTSLTSLIRGEKDEYEKKKDKLDESLLGGRSVYKGRSLGNRCAPDKNESLKRLFLERLCSVSYEDVDQGSFFDVETNKSGDMTVAGSNGDKKGNQRVKNILLLLGNSVSGTVRLYMTLCSSIPFLTKGQR